jgi:hypothetical protein
MVTLVTTIGKSSMDIYAQKLAENLEVPKLYSDIYQKAARLFNLLPKSNESSLGRLPLYPKAQTNRRHYSFAQSTLRSLWALSENALYHYCP